MKKIKSIKLIKDLPNIFKGAEGVLMDNNYCFDSNNGKNYCFDSNNGKNYFYNINDIKMNPDFFKIEYEPDYFELPEDNDLSHILCGSGEIDILFDNSYYSQGNAGSESEMEYRKMYNETMFYFRKLAEHLNGDWEYIKGRWYQYLQYNFEDQNFELIDTDSNLLPIIKFRNELYIETILSIAEPGMLENYKMICHYPY